MIAQFPYIDLRRFQLKLIFLSTGKAGQMSETENNAAPKKAKRKKRKAAKVVKVAKTVKRAIVKRAKASPESGVEKPFNAVIRRKEREIRKLKEMSAKAKAMAGE